MHRPSRSIAILMPAFAAWLYSCGNLMEPLGPPVFVALSYVPASCHLRNNSGGGRARRHQRRARHTRSRSRARTAEAKEEEEDETATHARRSMMGAQLLLAMRARRSRRALSTSAMYSASTTGAADIAAAVADDPRRGDR